MAYQVHTGLAGAYAALEQWCAANGRRRTGTSREVYGDWEEDPAKLGLSVCLSRPPPPRRPDER